MDATAVFGDLERHGATLLGMFDGLDDDEARWRPEAGKWSMLEVLGHLVDEEQSDFRVRIRLTLENPAAEWPAIDPPGWVVARRHNESTLATLGAAFRLERARSLAWLRTLSAPDWRRSHAHPTIGSLAAGDLLLAWAAHDLLHLRQLASLRRARLEVIGSPWSTRYAGG